MCAIDYAIVKRSEAQFWSRQSNSVAPLSCLAPSRSAPSMSAPSSSLGVVTLGDIMAQLQHMDARLDTLSTELYQVNVRVGHIARRQASMGGFAPKATPSPPSLVVMTIMLQMILMEMLALSMRCLLDTLTLYHSSQKGGVVLDMRVVILRRRVSIGPFC